MHMHIHIHTHKIEQDVQKLRIITGLKIHYDLLRF
jgi:hypothetical protein